MALRPITPRAVDVALGVGLAAVGVAEVVVPFSSRQGSGSAAVACGAVVVRGLALTQRRRHPFAAAGAVFATLWAGALLGEGYVLFYGQAVIIGVALFSVARHAPVREAAAGVGLGALTLVLADLTVPELQAPEEVVFHWSVATLLVVAALSLRRLARSARESQRRAVEVEVAAAEQAMAAVIGERARIARELHDIVAHAVSTIVVQAGAAEQVVEDDPALARRSLETIRATGGAALEEMRRLVTVLREQGVDGPLEPQPGLGTLPGLVETLRSSGLEVDVEIEGRVRPLPAGLDLAAFRIVQEGLTNVRRHSAARTAAVRIEFGPDELCLRVHDTGPEVGQPHEQGGHGLVGVRERVGLYGGRVEAGPDGRGGFVLSARLAVPS